MSSGSDASVVSGTGCVTVSSDGVARTTRHLQRVDHGMGEERDDLLRLRPPQILDLLHDVGPVEPIHPLPGRVATQERGLGPRPGDEIL